MFYAITGLGWGRGETIEEAKENYIRTQKRNFPHLTDEDLEEAWGFVWQPPEGVSGFYLDSQVHWQLDDGTTINSLPEQKVAPIGNVPDWAEEE